MPAVSSVSPSGIPYVDYVDSGGKWAVNSFTYSFPTSASFYVGWNGTAYGSGEENSGFKAFTAIQQAATSSILNMYSAVANVTFTQITETSTQSADLRYAESNTPSTAWGYYPSTSPEGGDAWFNNSSGWYNSPVVGNYAWLTIIHETGHLLGLKHPQDAMGSFGAAPAGVDSLEYSVMSYRSYTGASTTQGLTNGSWSFPTTLMMYDLAALQYMYGANYTTNNTDTVYKWNPLTGQESVNGVAQAAPGGNTIFMTIWDGGGNDTYDFSNYTTNVSVNLQPASWSTPSTAQLANLGAGHTAIGSIANAYLYNNNPASLIENAVGGSGNDTIIGNAANNKLTGGAGNDTIDGVSGTADTAVYSGASTSYQVTQNANGTWTVVDLRAGSPDGTDTLKNIEFLQFNDTTVAIGTVSPPPPVVQAPVITSFSPDSASVGDGITNANALTLTGTAQANMTVKVYDGTTLVGTVVSNANGGWSLPTGTLPDGTHNFTATATDSQGHISTASTATNVIVDSVAPVTPTITMQSVDSGLAGDGITNVNIVSLTGVAEINSTVKVYDGATLLGSATANAEGVWNFVADLSDDQILPQAGDVTGSTGSSTADEAGANQNQAWGFTTKALPDGVHNFTVTSTDAAGNVSTAAALNVTVDTVAPVAPTITSYSNDSGVAGDHITNDNTLTLTGTAEANSTVKIYDGATLLNSVTASGAGAWSYTTGALVNGVHSLTARATDAAGNTGAASTALSVTVDTAVPVAPVITSFSNDSGVVGDHITDDNTLTLTGTAEASSTVKIYDGATLLGSVKASTTGAWSYTTVALADGAHNLTATATDAAGNTSGASSVLAVTIDTSGPVVPTIASFSIDSGVLGDNITNDRTLTLSGTADANATVKVYDGSRLLGSVSADGSGAWSFTSAALANGAHHFSATATDAAGNSSGVSSGATGLAATTSNALSVSIDATAPVAPTIASLLTDSGVVGDHLTNDNTPTLSGKAEANATVKVYEGTTLLGSTTASATGAWSLTTNAALNDGAHNLTAIATDTAGNTGIASSPFRVSIDTSAPLAPAIATFSTDSGVKGDGITNDNTLTLTGTAEAGATVKLYDGATLLGSVKAGTTGAWAYTTAPLANGGHSLTATATDAAGNSGVASTALAVTVVVPTISSFSSDSGVLGDHITNDNTLALAGTAEANATVHVYDGSRLLGSTSSDGSGHWNFSTLALSDARHSLTVTDTDATGVTSSRSAALPITVDTKAPVAPTFTTFSTDSGVLGDHITNDSTPTLSGKAEANATVKVYDGATLLGQATAGATGVWNLTTASALTDGVHSLTATATDAAGNTGIASSTFKLTIDTAAPLAPSITAFSTDTGVLGDHTTSDDTPTLTGTAEAGATVKVYDGATLLGSVKAGTTGAWSYTTRSALPDGLHNLSATATDAAGNMGIASTTLALSIVAPGTPGAGPGTNDAFDFSAGINKHSGAGFGHSQILPAKEVSSGPADAAHADVFAPDLFDADNSIAAHTAHAHLTHQFHLV